MDDGGYQRPELWLSDGWALVQARGLAGAAVLVRPEPIEVAARRAPSGGGSSPWSGDRPVDPAEPVCHVSYYEADAFAHWTGDRLPTEAEWEAVAADAAGRRPPCSTSTSLHPALPAGGGRGSSSVDVWEWTSSAYSPYPGFRAAPGAVGEYNGKFMVNQYVLRGGSCATPAGHVRATYRNFFPASARWAFSGLRLARDL